MPEERVQNVSARKSKHPSCPELCSGWQQERWWTHCGDAAVFVGIVGYKELQRYGEQAMSGIAEETGFEDEELDDYMQALDKHGSPTAYLFQFRKCGQYGGYSDCD